MAIVLTGGVCRIYKVYYLYSSTLCVGFFGKPTAAFMHFRLECIEILVIPDGTINRSYVNSLIWLLGLR